MSTNVLYVCNGICKPVDASLLNRFQHMFGQGAICVRAFHASLFANLREPSVTLNKPSLTQLTDLKNSYLKEHKLMKALYRYNSQHKYSIPHRTLPSKEPPH